MKNTITIMILILSLKLIGVELAGNGFTNQSINHKSKKIIGGTSVVFDRNTNRVAHRYWIVIHYKFKQYWCSTIVETLFYDKNGKCYNSLFYTHYDIEDGFPAIYKPIIKYIDTNNAKGIR